MYKEWRRMKIDKGIEKAVLSWLSSFRAINKGLKWSSFSVRSLSHTSSSSEVEIYNNTRCYLKSIYFTNPLQGQPRVYNAMAALLAWRTRATPPTAPPSSGRRCSSRARSRRPTAWPCGDGWTAAWSTCTAAGRREVWRKTLHCIYSIYISLLNSDTQYHRDVLPPPRQWLSRGGWPHHAAAPRRQECYGCQHLLLRPGSVSFVWNWCIAFI